MTSLKFIKSFGHNLIIRDVLLTLRLNMKKRRKRNITRFIGFVLVYLSMATMLTVNNSSFYIAKKVKDTSKSHQNSKDNDCDSSEEEQSYIQELSVVGLMPISAIHLNTIVHTLFYFEFPAVEDVIYPFEQPKPLISYLENTFCYHIAINAP